MAKARLHDPDRPLAAVLFLGPTGVGKTECAKAISRTLFGDADRLLRFDLNEFNQPGAAARLVGTFAQPEGLLTRAIRRQPFAVVLLDEVEKADPEVFDLENRLVLLHQMANAPADEQPVYLWVRGFPDGHRSVWVHPLARHYPTAWADGLGVEVGRTGDLEPTLDQYAVRVKGVHARRLAHTEAGTHLFLPKHGGPVPVRVDVADLVCPPPYSPEVFRSFTLAALPRPGERPRVSGPRSE